MGRVLGSVFGARVVVLSFTLGLTVDIDDVYLRVGVLFVVLVVELRDTVCNAFILGTFSILTAIVLVCVVVPGVIVVLAMFSSAGFRLRTFA